MQFTKNIFKHLSNLPGWRTTRKIIVLESDDWGSIRMPSKKTHTILNQKGLDVSSRYNQFDSLETVDDLASLFEVLQSVKDKNNRSAVFTPVSIVANPDFEKIKASGFQQYYYEPFTETLKRYNREDVLKLWQQGVTERLFVPEFHGREHLNVQMWLRALQNNDFAAHLAFEYQMWGFSDPTPHGYLAAFDLALPEDIEYQKSVIIDGLDLFEQLHGYKASLIVPPNGPFNSQLEETAFKKGINFISTPKIHKEPLGNGEIRKKYFWLGKKNIHGQHYLTRNAAFEPCHLGRNWKESCLNEIEIGFKWHKPVIISTHRVNYIGAIDPSNRERSLKELKELLQSIVNKWPEAEFMTSTELGNLIKNGK